MERILIVEDDIRLGPTVRKGLAEQGYDVALAQDGRAALNALETSPPDLLVLDLGLPDCDGTDVLDAARGHGYDGPVLILTARDTLTDKVSGLDAGADDYMVKPFAFPELVARVRALLRRSKSAEKSLSVGDMTIDLISRRVSRGDETIELTPREFDLLAYLAHRAGTVVSRDALARDVWREPKRFTTLDNVIDVHISRLRRKLADAEGLGPVRVVRGVGIALEASV